MKIKSAYRKVLKASFEKSLVLLKTAGIGENR